MCSAASMRSARSARSIALLYLLLYTSSSASVSASSCASLAGVSADGLGLGGLERWGEVTSTGAEGDVGFFSEGDLSSAWCLDEREEVRERGDRAEDGVGGFGGAGGERGLGSAERDEVEMELVGKRSRGGGADCMVTSITHSGGDRSLDEMSGG